MGKGKGVDINLDFVFRLLELILLIVGLAMFMISSGEFNFLMTFHEADLFEASDALCIAGSAFVILLLIMLSLQLVKGEEQEQKFLGWLALIGTILLLSTGIAVSVIGQHSSTNIILSGVMAIMGGLALLVEALKDFGVF
uniref:MARVEL domain-containing protein n=1 Tax=Dendroctonus ponderosae TaxID=77166 RepID=A0AAR5PK31_DENPD